MSFPADSPFPPSDSSPTDAKHPSGTSAAISSADGEYLARAINAHSWWTNAGAFAGAVAGVAINVRQFRAHRAARAFMRIVEPIRHVEPNVRDSYDATSKTANSLWWPLLNGVLTTTGTLGAGTAAGFFTGQKRAEKLAVSDRAAFDRIRRAFGERGALFLASQQGPVRRPSGRDMDGDDAAGVVKAVHLLQAHSRLQQSFKNLELNRRVREGTPDVQWRGPDPDMD